MPSALVQQRCHNHAAREAVARCPECRLFFCRECVTEHAGRVVCRSCLEKLVAAKEKPAGRWGERLRLALGAVAGFLLTGAVFYVLGRLLIAIPSEFHDGTLFQP